MTHTNDDEAMARLAALSAKLRSQDRILSRSGIAEITPTRVEIERLDRATHRSPAHDASPTERR